jgi:hypothetical protein
MRIEFKPGALEALKWLALAAMVVDHVNAVFFDRSLAWAAPVGRIAMPVFAVVLAYNLARPGVDFRRSGSRLLFFGLLALPAHAALFAQAGGWWPLNIMATFAVAVLVIGCLVQRWYEAACLVFVAGGALVEYWWPGVALVVSSWWLFRSPGMWPGVAVLASFAGLVAISSTPWAILALPLLALATRIDVTVPRLRWVFWTFYPAHLAVIWCLAFAGVGAAHGDRSEDLDSSAQSHAAQGFQRSPDRQPAPR